MEKIEKETMRELIEKIRSFREKQSFVLVGVDGLGGAGKSTVAKYIKENILGTTIVEMDDFYIPELKRTDWDRLYGQVIEPLHNNSSASYQRFDWNTKKLAEWHTVEPKGVIVIEGVYVLREKTRNVYDYKIWVEAPYELRLQRGLERDGEEARDRWVDEWMPKEEEYKEIQRPHEFVDIIVDGSEN